MTRAIVPFKSAFELVMQRTTAVECLCVECGALLREPWALAVHKHLLDGPTKFRPQGILQIRCRRSRAAARPECLDGDRYEVRSGLWFSPMWPSVLRRPGNSRLNLLLQRVGSRAGNCGIAPSSYAGGCRFFSEAVSAFATD